VIDALLADEIDIGPLDSYALDLMLHHQPDLASQIRIVATTDPAPIPFLVAASNCPDESFRRCWRRWWSLPLSRHVRN
jgi:ABC-type phosphate/phosphonate transport system substrate-binding protein